MRIALCGEARSGKDTVASMLTNFISLAFGDYMKEKYYEANPHMVGQPKDREHMIAWSQPQVEEYNRIWIDGLEDHFNRYYWAGHNSFVITDLRQPHEEKWCRDNGFHIVRVHACEQRRLNRATRLGEPLGKDLPYWVQADFHIYNDGSLNDLQKSCKKLLQVLETTDKIKTVTERNNKFFKGGDNL